MQKPTLHLLMGLPGSGKTTLAKQIQNISGAVRLSSDEHRLLIFPEPKFTQKEHDNLYAMIDHNVEHLLKGGHDVIYDANLNRKVHRNEKYRLAKKHGADVVLWWVQAEEDLAKKRRVEEQNHKLLPDDETAEELFHRISDLIEEPEEDEKHITVDGTKVTKEYVQALLDKH